jgi:hypothetical protein
MHDIFPVDFLILVIFNEEYNSLYPSLNTFSNFPTALSSICSNFRSGHFLNIKVIHDVPGQGHRGGGGLAPTN